MGKEFTWRKTRRLKKIFALVEGQTEEAFVNNVLNKRWNNVDKTCIPIIVRTKVLRNGSLHKGGTTSYSKIEKQLRSLLSDSSVNCVTTMFDFYGLPNDFPGIVSIPLTDDPLAKCRHITNSMRLSINHQKFLPFIMLHEFESMLFSKPKSIESTFPGSNQMSALTAICNSFSTPEHINDSPATCPSKRLSGLYKGYQKILHGPIISAKIGINEITEKCLNFKNWIHLLDST